MLALLVAAPALSAAPPSPIVISKTSPVLITTLRARETGIVDELLFSPGDRVAAGQIVAKLDHFRQLYNLETARRRLHSQSPLAMAESDLKDKAAALEEAQTRHRRRQISDAELARITSQYEISSARLRLAKDAMEQAEADCGLAERLLQERFVYSPVAGRVVEVLKSLGERAQPGEPVVRVGDFSKLTADQVFSKAAASKMSAGSVIPVRMTAEGPVLEARIVSISAAPKATNGEKLVKLIFDNPEPDPAPTGDGRASSSAPGDWSGPADSLPRGASQEIQ